MDSPALLDTRTFFCAILKKLKADCIFDVGSRDGVQAVFFREFMPKARVAAFEASPENYQSIVAKCLDRRNIQVYPYAVSNRNGISTFYLADPESDPHALGSSSLHPGGYAPKQKIEVETCRLDDFTMKHYPEARRLALWIDVESAEFEVLEGISGILDRVLIVHTESSRTPVREGQKTLGALNELMKSFGFLAFGTNITPERNIGDVVYINEKALPFLGSYLNFVRFKTRLYHRLPIGRVAVFLRDNFAPLYRVVRLIYMRTT